MQGLVLEGGGAKGAFHVGALKALYERGYKFDGVAGTSIGAINGAMIAQGDFDTLFTMWQKITLSSVLDINEEMLANAKKKIDKDVIKYFFGMAKDVVSNRGFSTDKIEALLETYIDEDKLRASSCDYCIVTVQIDGTKWIPVELFKEDIPKGMLTKFVMASAYFPAFRRNPIDGRRYMDGGVYDNLPINPLIRKGYDNIVAIRTNSIMPHQKVVDTTVNIRYISPSEPMGGTLNFSKEIIDRYIKLGYYDCLRSLDGLVGGAYYVRPLAKEDFIAQMESLDYRFYKSIAEELGESGNKRNLLLSFIEKRTAAKLTEFERFIAWIEPYAAAYGIDKFRVYSLSDMLDELAKACEAQGLTKLHTVEGLEHLELFAALMRYYIKN